MPVTQMGSHFSFEKPLKPVALSGTLRLLYVDEGREAAAEFIREVGLKAWEVSHAQDAKSALELAKKQPVDVALISATADANVINLASDLAQLHPKLVAFILSEDV